MEILNTRIIDALAKNLKDSHVHLFFESISNLKPQEKEALKKLIDRQKDNRAFAINLLGTLVCLCYYINEDKELREKGLIFGLKEDKKKQGNLLTFHSIKMDEILAQNLIQSLQTQKEDAKILRVLQDNLKRFMYAVLAYVPQDKPKENAALHNLAGAFKKFSQCQSAEALTETWATTLETFASDLIKKR